MPIWVCATCGNHCASDEVCVICADERQWVPPTGQRWTTLEELRAAGHQSDIRELQPGLTGIGAEPAVAIGQRSILVQTTEGNLLWDPSGFIDDAAIDAARERGDRRGPRTRRRPVRDRQPPALLRLRGFLAGGLRRHRASS
jgi:hypothetical protein